MRTIFTLLIVCLLGLKVYAQRTLNDYKYVIVPANFEFLGEDDKYQLNSLTKFLFNKYGYTAYLEGEELPSDLVENGCLGMYVNLLKDNSLFKTKVRLEVKDCNGTVIQRSKTGETKEKLYENAFKIALRQAFETFQNADYAYKPKEKTKQSTSLVSQSESKDHVEVLEVETNSKMGVQPTKTDYNEDSHFISTVIDDEITTRNALSDKVEDALYAQPIAGGFQIVDTEPKKVMVLFNSGLKDVYIVEGKNAIVYKKDGVWFYEEYDQTLSTRTLNIKF